MSRWTIYTCTHVDGRWKISSSMVDYMLDDWMPQKYQLHVFEETDPFLFYIQFLKATLNKISRVLTGDWVEPRTSRTMHRRKDEKDKVFSVLV